MLECLLVPVAEAIGVREVVETFDNIWMMPTRQHTLAEGKGFNLQLQRICMATDCVVRQRQVVHSHSDVWVIRLKVVVCIKNIMHGIAYCEYFIIQMHVKPIRWSPYVMSICQY